MAGGSQGNGETHGFLTDTQRKYLTGERTDISDSYERTLKSRIKQRTANAIRDYEHVNVLQDDDLQTIIDSVGRENISDKEKKRIDEIVGGVEDHHIISQLSPLCQFIYRGVDRDIDTLESALESAIDWAEFNASGSEDGYVTKVNVEISVEREPFAESLIETLEEGGELTDRELGIILRNWVGMGNEPEELPELLREIKNTPELDHD